MPFSLMVMIFYEDCLPANADNITVPVYIVLLFFFQEMLQCSETSKSWQTFMETTSSNPNQQSKFHETLDNSSTALAKGIASHVMYGESSQRQNNQLD